VGHLSEFRLYGGWPATVGEYTMAPKIKVKVGFCRHSAIYCECEKMIDMCYAAVQVSYYISGGAVCINVWVYRSRLTRKREIQQNGKTGNSAKLENWKFNKSGNSTKTGKLDTQQIRIYHKNSKTGIL